MRLLWDKCGDPHPTVEALWMLDCLETLCNKYGGAEPNRAVLCVAEEAGEFVGAYRRWSGQARRGGTKEEMEGELADVLVTCFTAAESLGIDLPKALVEKAGVIMSRGDGMDEERGTFDE